MGKFTDRLRIKSNMIHMGEKIAFGSECELMDQAADIIDVLAEAHRSIAANAGAFSLSDIGTDRAFLALNDAVKVSRTALSKLESLSNE